MKVPPVVVFGQGQEAWYGVMLVGSVIFLTFGVQWWLRDADLEQRFANLPLVARTMFVVALLVSILLAPGDDRAFIYFQF